MSNKLIFRSLYSLIHCLFTILEWIFSASEDLVMFIVDFCHEFRLKNRTDCLEKDVHSRKKLPIHLTVLLGQEDPSYNDLANIVTWCMLNHIKFLSFFDYKGMV